MSTDAALNRMEEKIDRIQQDVEFIKDDHGKKLDDHGKKLEDHDARFDRIERGIEENRKLIVMNQEGIASNREGIASNREGIASNREMIIENRKAIDQVHQTVVLIEKVHGEKLEALMDGHDLLSNRIYRVEQRIDDFSQNFFRLETGQQEIKNDVSEIKCNVEKLVSIASDHEDRLQILEKKDGS